MSVKDDSPQDVTDDQRREEAYQATRSELLAQRSSNSEAYDKAVLTLSSAFLGFSLAFIKDAAQGNPLTLPSLMVASWGAFAAAIIAAVVSFQIGNHAVEVQLVRAEQYYRLKDETAYSRTTLARLVDYVNWSSGSFFVIGVILTILFVSINVLESNSMTKNSKSGPTHAQDAQRISNMAKVDPVKRAQPISNMQKVTPTPAPQPATPAPTSDQVKTK